MRIENGSGKGVFNRLTNLVATPHIPNQSILIDSGNPVGPHRMVSETHFAVSDIGSEILIRRIFSKRNLNPNLKPIVLVHGVACNGNIFRMPIDGIGSPYDLTTNSMANYLAEYGFDVYVVHLSTSKRVFRRYSSKFKESQHFGNEKYDFHPRINFDKLVAEELPTLLEKVLQINGCHDEVFYLAHSMGGMMAYAYLGTHDCKQIKAAVTYGSSIFYNQANLILLDKTDKLARILGMGGEKNPVRQAAENLVPLGVLLSHTHKIPGIKRIANTGYAVDQVKSRTASLYFRKAAEPFPPQLRKQFLRWSQTQSFTNYEEHIDYADAMRNIRIPFLLFGGRRDHLGKHVKEAHERIKGSKYIEVDAGHGDLIFGKDAMTKVWGPTVDWLIQKNDL